MYYDEPHLIALDSGKSKVVAVSIPDTKREFPFLATLISPRDWERYMRGIVDLRYLFVYSKKDKLFSFDLSELNHENTLMMEPIEASDVLEEWLPDRQFFSRDHTEPLEDMLKGLTGHQRFSIDGEWALPDFARFYAKFSDIYTFEVSVNKYADKKVSDGKKERIEKAFYRHPFRGGASYGNFYKDLSHTLPLGEQPGVNRVQYASPGYVEIRGKQEVIDKINQAIENFEGDFVEIKTSYNHLYGHLSKLGFLRSSPKQFDNNTKTAMNIMDEAEKLAALLKMDHLDVIKSLCEQNALVFAKIVLSYSRRVEGAFDFFAEGRADFSESPIY